MASDAESYGFTWPGKREALLEAGRPTDKVLRPILEDSVNFSETENIYIDGDNLEALKIILKSYMRRVKMIYIDPPYNTGHDFIYPDDYSQSEEESQRSLGFEDDSGRNYSSDIYREHKRSNPRFHSEWCSMIYPRLKLAHMLLSEDGVIFISIDDSEQAKLRMICDEIFGENNFVACLVWERAFAPKNDAKYVSASHDYVLMYAKSIDDFKIGRLPRTEEANARYSNPDNDPRGVWKSGDLLVKTYSAAYDYPITLPSGRIVEPPPGRCWRLSQEAFAQRVKDNRIWFGADGDGVPRNKTFLSELKHEGMSPVSILYYKNAGHSQEGAQEVAKILGGLYFDSPKPVRLLQRIMIIANLKPDSIILDFFAGSSTTAHAVMSLNAQDSGHRKFIMIQIAEPCPEKSEAFKAGYHTIAEIGRERIRRAGQNLMCNNQQLTTNNYTLDSGFRAFKITDSNYRDVFRFPDEITQENISDMAENIKPDRTDLDLLFMCAADFGLPLSLPYRKEIADGFTVHIYGDKDIAACFGENISEEAVKFIAKMKPKRAVFRDSCFGGVCSRINMEQVFEAYAGKIEMTIL